MTRVQDLITRLAVLLADDVAQALAQLPPSERPRRLTMALARLSSRLARDVHAEVARRLLAGQSEATAVRMALATALREFFVAEVARIMGQFAPAPTLGGLGAAPAGAPPTGPAPAGAPSDGRPPDGTPAQENDDITIHNIAPGPKEKADWEGRQYRGLWYPAYLTPITDLTPDDVGLATAFLAGKLTQKGCPKSDAAKKQQDDANFLRRIFQGVQMVAGVVATTVMGAIYGPIAGMATQLLHRGKMALIERFWREKIVNDPAVKLMLEKLGPVGPFSYRGFTYHMRPLGNMLVKELGCGADLQTRLLLHGRMLRVLDVLCASAPAAKSKPGLYDYQSSFGMLRGSIFPPRGPGFDGGPPPPAVEQQVNRMMRLRGMQAVVKSRSLTLTKTAESFVAPRTVPAEVAASAVVVHARVVEDQARGAQAMAVEKPELPSAPNTANAANAPGAPKKKPSLVVPALIAGGALLGIVALARS